MQTKTIEVRDSGTFIPAIAVLLVPDMVPDYDYKQLTSEAYLLRRAGLPIDSVGRRVLLCNLNTGKSSIDPYGWGIARTMGAVHKELQAN